MLRYLVNKLLFTEAHMDYKDLIATNISKITGLDKDKVYSLIEIPPQLDMGDYAFPCFTLAKELRKAPPVKSSHRK